MNCTWALARVATLHPKQLATGPFAEVVLASREDVCLHNGQWAVPDRMLAEVMSIGESVQSGAAHLACLQPCFGVCKQAR